MKNSENNSASMLRMNILSRYVGLTQPKNPKQGDFYYDENSGSSFVYVDDEFIELPDISNRDFFDLYDAAIKYYGFPELPEDIKEIMKSRTLFNTEDRKLYVFDGAEWIHIPVEYTVEDINKIFDSIS